MSRALLVILAFALTVYALVDLWQTRSERVQRMPRPVWALLIIILPIAGALFWILGGKSNDEDGGNGGTHRAPAPRPVAPDDDIEFLAELDRKHRAATGDENPHRRPTDNPENDTP